jgi:tRNA (guanine-N7-)-methyltransferase
MTLGNHSTDHPGRRIRSFVRREGRLTSGQQKALDQLWPVYGLPADRQVDMAAVFDRAAPLTLEIGFGNGESLADMAGQAPDRDFIGIEVHRPGVGHLLKLLHEHQLGNVRVLCHDAVEVLKQCIGDHSLERVLLFFPDPWHKKKHHKRRIVQPDFASLLAYKLKPGGQFHIATDWPPYAEHMRDVMEASEHFCNCAGPGQFSPKPDYRPITKFERRGQRLGHQVHDLLYQRLPWAGKPATP